MKKPGTRITLEIRYPDQGEYCFQVGVNTPDLSMDELYQQFKALALAAGYAPGTVSEYFEADFLDQENT